MFLKFFKIFILFTRQAGRMSDLPSAGSLPEGLQQSALGQAKAGSLDLTLLSHMGIKGPSTSAITCLLPRECVSKKLKLKEEPALEPKHSGEM